MTREEALEFSELFGRLFEDTGATRIAGRLVGWLLICEPAEQSQAELVELLAISKASVSTELRMLERIGLLERITLPGDRRSYYRIAPHAWPELMARRLRIIEQFIAAAAHGIELLADEPSERSERLASLHRGYSVLARAMDGALLELREQAAAAAKVRPRTRASKQPKTSARARTGAGEKTGGRQQSKPSRKPASKR